MFRSAYFGNTLAATGIRDRLPPPDGVGRDYGRGFWRQQWLGLKRMSEYLARRRI